MGEVSEVSDGEGEGEEKDVSFGYLTSNSNTSEYRINDLPEIKHCQFDLKEGARRSAYNLPIQARKWLRGRSGSNTAGDGAVPWQHNIFSCWI